MTVSHCPDIALCSLAFILQLRKNHGNNLSQGIQKLLGWSAPNAIRLADLAIIWRWLWPA